MAFFIVIGTNNDVKGVVDEVKRAHLQHNVITSGCVLSKDNALYYQWDVFNENGEKTYENKEPIALHNALTNQISQFKTLLPENAIPNVFVVSKCFDGVESETLQMVCNELYKIGGAKLSGLQVDIILLGYNLNKPADVTVRPHWRLLESLKGLGAGSLFHTNVLYINNMDYTGAATNVDSRVLGRFLCHWSKVVCSGGYDPKSTIVSKVYAIGISEYQYDFRDLTDFFKLSAEEKLIDRTLNSNPSSDTQELLDSNYYEKIDLSFLWLDGLCHIQSLWKEYCSTEWDPSKPLLENTYSVSRHELTLASYLNKFLELYISEERFEIDILKATIQQLEMEKSSSLSIGSIGNLSEDGSDDDGEIVLDFDPVQVDSEIEECEKQIQIHLDNIERNTFLNPDEFHEKYGGKELITETDIAEYAEKKAKVAQLIKYVKSDAGIGVMREAVKRATVKDILPDSYPAFDVLNIGRVKEIDPGTIAPIPNPGLPEADINTPKEINQGCLLWFKKLFKRKKEEDTEHIDYGLIPSRPPFISHEANQYLNDKLDKSVAAIRNADKIRSWWSHLCDIIDNYQKRLAECKLLTDGEKDFNGMYIPGKEGYRPAWNRKSTSLIDMDKVRRFMDEDLYYKQNIDLFLKCWFDKERKMTMPELIKHQVLDPLGEKFHTLRWDGSNPFINEIISDEQMHEIIESDLKQSKPFIEYIRIQESNIVSNLSIGFFSNNPNITTKSSEFINRYKLSSDSIIPVFLQDFTNSLCVIQVLDIPDHIESLKDFKPKREARLSWLHTEIDAKVISIVGEASSIVDKAKKIYDWICSHIAYDTTKQIHDAETCYKTGRGVCQAYCELFCYMAEAVGITADIICGVTKNPQGEISTEKHAWVFVYTHAYDGIFIDPTWGAGYVSETKFFKSTENSKWFNVSPYWMIFSHFPDERYWTKLDIEVSREQFESIPFHEPEFDTDGKDVFFESLSEQNHG